VFAAVILALSLAAPTTAERCPHGLLTLGRNAIAPATEALVRAVPKKEDPQVVSATLATSDPGRGRQAKFECGAAVWRRTIVVYYTRRAYLPAQSASQGVAFVGRFRGGYRVWELVH
jgi:hypothetical protein